MTLRSHLCKTSPLSPLLGEKKRQQETPVMSWGLVFCITLGSACHIWMCPNIGFFSPKMDDENNGSKPYENG